MSVARNNEVSTIGAVVVLALTVLIVFFARDLLVLLAFALLLAFLLAPAVSFLEARRAPRVVAVGIAGVLTFTVLCVVGFVVARQLLNVARDLPAYRLTIQKKTAGLHFPAGQSLESAFTAVEGISRDFSSNADEPANGPRSPVQAQPVRIVDPNRDQLEPGIETLVRFLRPIGSIGVVIVFTLYFLVEREDLRRRILLLAGISRIRLMNQALQDAANRISQYLFSQVIVNAAYGALFGLGLFAIGVPNATFWGVFAGLLRIVPYAGSAVGMALPLVVCLATSTSWIPPLLLIGIFLVLELTTTNIVEPLVFQSRTGISSLALLTMAIFWALLWGWPGLILSTPLTVCIVVLGRHVPRMSFLHALLGADAELSPDALFYERLLAMNQQEARIVANRFLETRSLVELYDLVVIPALGLVEHDRHQGVLDEVSCNFCFLTIGELIAELTDAHPGRAVESDLLHRFAVQQDFAVVCISAADQADELTTHMLVQVMERASNQTLYLPSTVSDEILDSLAAEPNTVIFISALPPFAFSQTRSICHRVRSHLPQNRIVVGLWNTGEDPGRSQDLSVDRFGSGQPTAVVNTLAQAVYHVTQWHQQTAQDLSSAYRNAGFSP